MVASFTSTEDDLIARVSEALDVSGICIIENVLNAEALVQARMAASRARQGFEEEVGAERLARARSYGDHTVRFAMKYDPFFLSLFELPIINDLTGHLLSPNAILKYLNVTISDRADGVDPVQQRHFHMNTRQLHGSVMTSMDIVFPLLDWTAETVALYACMGTHRRGPLSKDLLEKLAEPVDCAAGSVVVMDSTLWHFESPPIGRHGHLVVDLQFTMPYIKPHIDYVRALGPDTVEKLPERTRRYLGWDARVPASVDEFYVPSEQRMYKGGQP